MKIIKWSEIDLEKLTNVPLNESHNLVSQSCHR